MKAKVDFIEMPLSVFASSFLDEYTALLEKCPALSKIDLSDDNYVIRIDDNGCIEIGYPSDEFVIGS